MRDYLEIHNRLNESIRRIDEISNIDRYVKGKVNKELDDKISTLITTNPDELLKIFVNSSINDYKYILDRLVYIYKKSNFEPTKEIAKKLIQDGMIQGFYSENLSKNILSNLKIENNQENIDLVKEIIAEIVSGQLTSKVGSLKDVHKLDASINAYDESSNKSFFAFTSNILYSSIASIVRRSTVEYFKYLKNPNKDIKPVKPVKPSKIVDNSPEEEKKNVEIKNKLIQWLQKNNQLGTAKFIEDVTSLKDNGIGTSKTTKNLLNKVSDFKKYDLLLSLKRVLLKKIVEHIFSNNEVLNINDLLKSIKLSSDNRSGYVVGVANQDLYDKQMELLKSIKEDSLANILNLLTSTDNSFDNISISSILGKYSSEISLINKVALQKINDTIERGLNIVNRGVENGFNIKDIYK